jgi:ATP-dependent DNA helicase RecG
MSEILEQDIKFLPGVGPKRAELLKKELDIETFRDLLYYFPYKYIDRTKFYRISEVNNNVSYIQLKGIIRHFELVGEKNKQRLVAQFQDESGIMELVWFQGIKWVRENVRTNTPYVIFGKPSIFNHRASMIHPELEPADSQNFRTGVFQAFYNTTENLKKKFITSKIINGLQFNLAQAIDGKIYETLPSYLIAKLKLMPLKEALKQVHFPENPTKLRAAQFRLKFEELFYIQLKILSLKHQREERFKGFRFTHVGYNLNTFYEKHLPFELTGAQKKVIREIRRDMGSGRQMNRLLQGDVGSGKTLVALMTALIAFDNGFQVCLMAPTEILASQHYINIRKMTEGLGITVSLLTGSTKTAERRTIHAGLADGSLQLLVGTHALIEDTVNFRNLGLVIIDEQHRFGVAQRPNCGKRTIQFHRMCW